MDRVFRDRKSLQPSGRPAWARGVSRLLVAATFAGSVGCDIVQGFQQAGDTLFPQQSTHLAAPGARLVAGHYQHLSVILGTELYLLAREADDDTGKLFSMRYANYGEPTPCLVPGVGPFWATNHPRRKPPLFAYFHESVNRGTLHFADANCRLYDTEFVDARLPVAETETNLVVWAGSDLWLSTPETGAQELLAPGVEEVIGGVFGGRSAVRAAGRIGVFGSDWKGQGYFGDQVTTVQRAPNSLFFSDSAGVHRLVASEPNGQGLRDELLAADGCGLGMQDSVWATFRAPCGGGSVVAVHEPTGRKFTLAFDANPQQLILQPARQSPGLDPTKDPFWFFGLRDGATADTAGTLVVKTPSGKELTLGSHATLRQLRVVESAGEPYGYALVDVPEQGQSGRYLWWNAQGETKILAENTMWQPSRLIVDFDGTYGKLAVTSGDRLLVLTEGVPWPAFEYRDATQQWTVLFHDLHLPGQNGGLSAFYGTLDGLQATAVEQPFVAPELIDIAPSVGVFRTSGLSDVLSGVIYLADYDVSTGTGRLEYRNMELRFTALVNYDVSDYLVSNDQVLYAIPRGANAGLWLVSGK